MDAELQPLIGQLRGDPQFEAMYQKSSFLLNRGLLELLKVVTALHNPRAPDDVKAVMSRFNPVLWLSNWLKLNNPTALPYNAAIAAVNSPQSRPGTVSSSTVALECLAKRPVSLVIDSAVLQREKKRAQDIAALSVYLFIECRRIQRVRELDAIRLQREAQREEDYQQQVIAREARVRAKQEALQQMNFAAAPRHARRKSAGSLRVKRPDEGSVVAEDEPAVERDESDVAADLFLYVEIPEEVLAVGYEGVVDKDTVVECLYNDKDALALLRLPPRKAGSRPPFSSLFRAVAPASPSWLGPGPASLCECLWALAFRHTTPLTLPYTYGVPGMHAPVPSVRSIIATMGDGQRGSVAAAEHEMTRERAKALLQEREGYAAVELATSKGG